MEHRDRRGESNTVGGVGPGLSQLTGRPNDDHGVTLVELLVALAISCVIISVVLYTGNYEMTSWKQVTTTSNLHSDVQYADEKLQQVFQNLTGVNLDANFPVETTTMDGTSVTAGTAVVGTDNQGQTVEVCVQPLGPQSTGESIVIEYTPSGAKGPSKTVTLPAVNTTFAGTVFVVDGRLVIANYNTQTVGSASPQTYQLSATYATEGGY